MKKKEEEVIVTFNGRNHTLKELAKMETAAADDELSKDWFSSKEDEPEAFSYPEDLPYYEETPSPVKPKFITFKRKPKMFKPTTKRKKTPQKPRYFSKHQNSGFKLPTIPKNFWLPFFSAIVVGLGLGFSMLIYFSNNAHQTSTQQSTTGATPSSSTAQTANQSTSASTTAISVDATDLSIQTDVVQTSAVKTKALANTNANNISKLGLPVVETAKQGNGLIYLFSGISNSMSEATQIGNIYTGDGAQVYPKPWNLSVKKLKLTPSIHKQLTAEKDTFSKMINASSELMINGVVSKTTTNQLNKSYEGLKIVTKNSPKPIQNFYNQINPISQLLNIAVKNPTGGNKRVIQQKLLEALFAYQKLITSYK